MTVGAGPGTNPFYTPGKAYLAGPYKGAPLSLAFITPAVAGPFDLGTVVIRAAAYLDPATAQVTVKTDPLPQILDGIPLRLRSITTTLDRADFTLNPTDCSAMSVTATVNGASGASASPSEPFQVGDCDKLGFKPDLKLALKGKVNRRAHPSLRATLTPARATPTSPPPRSSCRRPPSSTTPTSPGSAPGSSSQPTPARPARSTATPRRPRRCSTTSSSRHRSTCGPTPPTSCPTSWSASRAPPSQPIEIELAGKTDSVKGALRNTFEAVPDVPVTKFSLDLFGGKKGLIEMSSGFCKNPSADYKLTGQNGAIYNTTPKVAAKCPKGKKGKKKGSKGAKRPLAAVSNTFGW